MVGLFAVHPYTKGFWKSSRGGGVHNYISYFGHTLTIVFTHLTNALKAKVPLGCCLFSGFLLTFNSRLLYSLLWLPATEWISKY